MTAAEDRQDEPAGVEAPRRHLGRGLNALFGDEQASSPPEQARAPGTAPIEHLRPGKYQPRGEIDVDALAELVESIRDKGILQPLLVRPDPDQPGRYEIIAGERRWRAAQMAQLHDIPVVVRELSDQQALEIALVENLQRQDLSALDEALGYRRLMDEFSHTQEGLAKAVGKSRSHVANTMRLLSLPEAVKAMLAAGSLSAGHARALLGAEDAAGLAQQIVRKGMSVRQAEQLVAAGRSPSRQGRGIRRKDPDTKQLEDNIGAVLGMPVAIQTSGEGGKLVIRYANLEQLEDVLTRLTRSGSAAPAVAAATAPVAAGAGAGDADPIPDWAEDDADALLSQIEAMFGDEAEPDDTLARSREQDDDVPAGETDAADKSDDDLDRPFRPESSPDETELDDETERFLKELEQIVGPIPDDDAPSSTH
ncbi:MAG: ParB/RepB/Spo0J family partition protein [Acetobacterales bacterium]